MNLHDIIPVEKRAPRFTATKIKETTLTLSRIENLRTIRAAPEIDKDDGKVIDAVVVKMQTTFARQRRDIANQFGGLPDSLINNSVGAKDSIGKFAQSPRVRLSDVRSLADVFGFVVIPWSYFVQNEVAASNRPTAPKEYSNCNLCTSEQGERYHKAVCLGATKIGVALKEPELKRATSAFISEAEIGKRFVPYVLCPVSYYSLQHHVLATDDLPIYPGPFEQAFMGINMSVPMFRQLARKVSALESQTSAATVRLDTVDTELKNLARRLGEMERAEEQRQREAVIARQREAEQAAQIAETARRLAEIERFIPYDPMLLAVPADIGILGEGSAVVGPCWGPDFDEVVATLRGYKRLRGQRKLISRIEW